MQPNPLQPPTTGAKPTALPGQTWATAPRSSLLGAPFGASGVAPAPQQATKSANTPQFNTDRENQIRSELTQDKNPTPPELKEVPKAPVAEQTDPFSGIAPIVMLLGGLAAGKTLNPATTMLNSFAEFNKARAAGDNERAKTAHEAWKDSAQQVVDTNKDRLSTYKEILEANKGDKRALEAELTSLISEDKLYAAMHKDDGSGIYSTVSNYVDSTGKATDKLASHLDDLKAQDAAQTAQATIDSKLAKIKPEDRGIVQAVGEGRMLPAEIGRGKKREQVMAAVADIYKDQYDSGKIAQRRKYLTSFASPSAIQREQTLNSTIGHMSDLNDVVGQMSTSDIQALNSMSQEAIKKLGKGSIYYRFNENRNLLAEELSKLYKGGSPAQAEIESHKQELFSAMSMEQLHATLGQIARNLEDAGDAIGDVRERRTGESAAEATPYTGQSKNRLDKVFSDTGVEGHHAGQTPDVGAVIDGYKFNGGDPSDQNNWEKQ